MTLQPTGPRKLQPSHNPIINPQPKERDWQASELDGAEIQHRRRPLKRDWMFALRVSNAAKHLERLPEPGESIHAVMRGNFNAWDLIPAALQMMHPATIGTLRTTTLGFNRRNSKQLVDLIDDGKIARCFFICSLFYEQAESAKGECDYLRRELAERNGAFISVRNHSKVQTFDTSDGNHYVIESSANLRSCRNIEQFTLSNDAGLLAFHAQWIDRIFQHGEEDREEGGSKKARAKTKARTKKAHRPRGGPERFGL